MNGREVNAGGTYFIRDWDEFYKETKHCFMRKDYERVRPLFTKRTLKVIQKQFLKTLFMLHEKIPLWDSMKDFEKYEDDIIEDLKVIQEGLNTKKARVRII